jgi:hypothetical protein
MGSSIQIWSKDQARIQDYVSTNEYRVAMDYQYLYESMEVPSKDLAEHNNQRAPEASIV